MGVTKNKIRLSRSLRAQIMPYPEIGQWLKRGIAIFSILLAVGIYVVARPHSKTNSAGETNTGPKQILGEQAKSAESETYEIKKGDTLFNLSSRFNVSWQTLAEINHLQEPYILKVGQKIKIPANQ